MNCDGTQWVTVVATQSSFPGLGNHVSKTGPATTEDVGMNKADDKTGVSPTVKVPTEALADLSISKDSVVTERAEQTVTPPSGDATSSVYRSLVQSGAP